MSYTQLRRDKRTLTTVLEEGPLKMVHIGDTARSSVPQLTEFQIQQIEHNTRTLQKSIKYLLENAPDFCEYLLVLESPDTDQIVKFAMRKPLLQLATVIKSKWKILSFPELQQIVDDDLKLSNTEKEELINIEPEVIPRSDSSKSTDREVSQVEPTVYASVKGMPPLPEIRDPELRQRVFIHKSTYTNKLYLNPSEIIGAHNERLEFLGDSVLNHLVTKMIFNRFPDASEGELSSLRSLLVKNSVLTELSLKYGFDKHLKSTINESDLRDGKQKIYADIFEAYVGALTRDGTSQDVIQNWLSELMEGLIKEYEFSRQLQEPINRDAKTELYSMIGTASSHPIYEVEQMGDGSKIPFVIRCQMGDEVLGRGIAAGNKEAGLRAAMSALKNRELLAKYSHLRLLLDRGESVVKKASPSPDPARTTSDTVTGDTKKIELGSIVFPLTADQSVPLIIDAKNQLYPHFQRVGITPDYVYSKAGDQYLCLLTVNGTVYARALGMNKKTASQHAASVFINNLRALDLMLEHGFSQRL